MKQYFMVEGKSLTVDQMRAWREEKNRKSAIFCKFCVSKMVKHKKDCPTLLPDFNQETAHELTKEERELLIAK